MAYTRSRRPQRVGLCTTARTALASSDHILLGDQAPPGRIRLERKAWAFAWPYHVGAQSALLRENYLCAYPRACQVSPFVAVWPFSGGAGSARPQGRLRFHRESAPLGREAFVRPR
jgi:hypothetical protein